MKIFITRQIPGKALEELKKIHEVEIWPGPGIIPRDILLKKTAGTSAVIPMLTEKMDSEFFDKAGPDLKIVANYAVGFDNIDLDAASQKNIAVTNTPSHLGDSVAELTIALILALSRRIVESDKWMREGNYTAWDPSLFLGLDLSEKTIGIVGLGTIGLATARLADSVLGMKVVYTARSEKPEAAVPGWRFEKLPQLLSEVDVISLHVPLTPKTRHMIGKDQLDLMKPSAILINTSRGPVINEAALYEALVNRRIWGAAIDVYENETGLADDSTWWKMTKLPNIIMTPHIGSATIEAREEMTKIAVENVLTVLSGKPPVNPV
ncbi:D-glycerate dehydrogenase [Candidatus Collierbacteria bacterium]|nr:D-glycerate dehydrogenase [Candidatus Collierbacteria bacterium]